MQCDHDVDEPVESNVPGRETGGRVHGHVRHQERGREGETIPKHRLVDVSRQLILFGQYVYDVLTVIGRRSRLLGWSGSRLLQVQRGVRGAMSLNELY